jgi:hypothetical protein
MRNTGTIHAVFKSAGRTRWKNLGTDDVNQARELLAGEMKQEAPKRPSLQWITGVLESLSGALWFSRKSFEHDYTQTLSGADPGPAEKLSGGIGAGTKTGRQDDAGAGDCRRTAEPFLRLGRRVAALVRLAEPKAALERLEGLVVLDEVQRKPELFALLRVLADRQPVKARFLLTGSASPDLVRGVSETLAGRVALVDVAGFNLSEVGDGEWRQLWWRGGFPRAFLADTEAANRQWQEEFVRTLLERDMPQLGVTISSVALRRFWTMLTRASWEGFALEQVLSLTGDRDAHFWATHGGAELDLLVNWGGRKYGFEFKYGDAPSLTKSMHTALHDLKLERLFVVHPGQDSYVMNDQTEAVGITHLRARLAQAGVGSKAI